MPRFCSSCGRPLTPDYHDEGERVFVRVRRGRGRLPIQRIRRWACRVRLIATHPNGTRFVPDTPDRTLPEAAAFVHDGRLR